MKWKIDDRVKNFCYNAKIANIYIFAAAAAAAATAAAAAVVFYSIENGK